MAKSTHPLLLRLAPWLLPVGTVIVWQLASSVGWLSTRVLPSPEGVLKAFWTLSASGELWQHLAISSWRALVGFAIGGSIGSGRSRDAALYQFGRQLLRRAGSHAGVDQLAGRSRVIAAFAMLAGSPAALRGKRQYRRDQPRVGAAEHDHGALRQRQ